MKKVKLILIIVVVVLIIAGGVFVADLFFGFRPPEIKSISDSNIKNADKENIDFSFFIPLVPVFRSIAYSFCSSCSSLFSSAGLGSIIANLSSAIFLRNFWR